MWASFLYRDQDGELKHTPVTAASAVQSKAQVTSVTKGRLREDVQGTTVIADDLSKLSSLTPVEHDRSRGEVKGQGTEIGGTGDTMHTEHSTPVAVTATKDLGCPVAMGTPQVGAPSYAWNAAAQTTSSSASSGGAPRHGYLSFSDVQLENEEADEADAVETESTCSLGSAGRTLRNSGRMSREVLQQRLKKRASAWRRFLAVMQVHGLQVRKHHRRGKGCASRVVKYDPDLPGLRWKTQKWWNTGGGQLPLRDVLDVERRGKVVWVKCLHLGNVGFEASLEADAVIFYLAMDSLLNKRCGVDERQACLKCK